jgi:hypothetical protein
MVDDDIVSQAEQHVAEIQRIIAAHHARIECLRALGCGTLDAEQTLSIFEDTLRVFEQHRDWLRKRAEAPAAE